MKHSKILGVILILITKFDYKLVIDIFPIFLKVQLCILNYDGLAISGEMKDMQLERLPIEPGFWFEWVAFHPNTLVYGDSN